MNITALVFLGYVSWFLLLVLIMVSWRTVLIYGYGRPVTSFHPDGSDVSPLMVRLTRAYVNGYENFPIIGGVLLFALALGQTQVTDPLAPILLVARILQSITHCISVNSVAIKIRFSFFLIQIGIVIYWILQLASQLI